MHIFVGPIFWYGKYVKCFVEQQFISEGASLIAGKTASSIVKTYNPKIHTRTRTLFL